MLAGKKIAAKAQKRSIHHVAATEARNKRIGVGNPNAFKAPGSMKKKSK